MRLHQKAREVFVSFFGHYYFSLFARLAKAKPMDRTGFSKTALKSCFSFAARSNGLYHDVFSTKIRRKGLMNEQYTKGQPMMFLREKQAFGNS